MPLVHVPRSLAALFPGLPRHVEVAASDLAGVIRALDGAYPGIWDRLCEPGPRLRAHINAFVDGQPAALADRVERDSVIHLIPAVSGGIDEAERLHARVARDLARLAGGASRPVERCVAGPVEDTHGTAGHPL